MKKSINIFSVFNYVVSAIMLLIILLKPLFEFKYSHSTKYYGETLLGLESGKYYLPNDLASFSKTIFIVLVVCIVGIVLFTVIKSKALVAMTSFLPVIVLPFYIFKVEKAFEGWAYPAEVEKTGAFYALLACAIFILLLSSIMGLIENNAKKQKTEKDDENLPVQIVKAKIISKAPSENKENYFLIFEDEDGKRIGFDIPKNEVMLFVEEDIGFLKYQGKSFIKFIVANISE